MNYYDTIIASKNNQYYELLQKYRNIYNQIQKGKMFLKKGVQLTQENIICMDKYGKKDGDHTSINDINDDIDHGQVSEIYEENELYDNILKTILITKKLIIIALNILMKIMKNLK